ncbi:MAG: DNA-binding protein [Lachnospiraceae bacterium]|nr:DNA-binding protein [Lachnospiraceae bacterium]
MKNTVFIKASEIAEELQISQPLAYRMIREWNEQLRAKGYTTIQGRVSRQYFEEQIYGLADRKEG